MIDDFTPVPGDEFDKPMPVPQQVETEEIIFHKDPRISANKLAEYVVSDPSRQKAIIREAKFAKKVMIVRYQKARKFVAHAFGSDSLDIDKLVRRAEEIEKENETASISEWHKTDNTNSSLILKKVAAVAPDLTWKNARPVHLKLGGTIIAGVKVSVDPELIFAFDHRNIRKVGGIILNTAKGDEKSLARSNGSYCVGDYLSSLLFQTLLAKLNRVGAPLNSKCYAVDVFREKIYTAPANFKILNRHLEAACEVIALRWPEIGKRA